MRTSEAAIQPAIQQAFRPGAITTGLILAAVALGMLWLMQGSINTYIQQQYHRPTPLPALRASRGWEAGASLWRGLERVHDGVRKGAGAISAALRDQLNDSVVLTPRYWDKQRQERARIAREKAEQERQYRLALARDAALAEQVRIRNYLTIAAPAKVLFAGDSLMQGVAPQLQRSLHETYGIDSINLSKQSTGLAYPSAFDWPATIETALDGDPEIRLVVVMLGPNDPWDMADPAHPGRTYLKFESPAWEAVYRARVARILDAAKAHDASVLWIGAPGMKREQLDTQMAWLMPVIRDEVTRHGAVFVDTRPLLSMPGQPYSDAIMVDGQLVKMRSGDGIHFSPSGQAYIAKHVQAMLTVK